MLWAPELGVADWIALWHRQVEVIRAVARNPRVAVRSGHKVGKTLLAVLIALWWIATRPRGRVIVIAPTDRQIKRGVWYELGRLATALKRRGVHVLPDDPPVDPQTGLRWGDGRELFGFSAENADAVSGPSSPDLLVIVDEAAGVPDSIYEALLGMLAGGGHLLALGNATQPTGWFIEAFKSDGWFTLRISSEETPNVRAGAELIPGLATKDFVDRIASDYGRDSPVFAVRVSGDPPSIGANTVIGLGLVEAARQRWEDADHKGATLDLGVDVALYGDDDSAIVPRRGLTLYSPKWVKDTHGVEAIVHGYDAAKVAGQIVLVIKAMRRNRERVRIKLDAGGGYGSAVASHLRELRDQRETEGLDEFVDIIEINVATSSSEPDKYPQLRDELWFGLRAFLAEGGTFSPDPRLESDMQAPRYAPTRKGQLKVDDKKTIKKTLGRSPDPGDAACLAVYEMAIPIRSARRAAAPASRWAGMSGRGF